MSLVRDEEERKEGANDEEEEVFNSMGPETGSRGEVDVTERFTGVSRVPKFMVSVGVPGWLRIEVRSGCRKSQWRSSAEFECRKLHLAIQRWWRTRQRWLDEAEVVYT